MEETYQEREQIFALFLLQDYNHLRVLLRTFLICVCNRTELMSVLFIKLITKLHIGKK